MNSRSWLVIGVASTLLLIVTIGGAVLLMRRPRYENQPTLPGRVNSAASPYRNAALERRTHAQRHKIISRRHRAPIDIAPPVLESTALIPFAEHSVAANPEALTDPLTTTSAADVREASVFVAPSPPTASRRRLTHPNFMAAMYATYGALQTADLASTFNGLGNGAREANPFLKRAAENRALMIGVKVAGTAATVVLIEKLRKKNPVAASVTLMAVNAALAAVVANNAGVGNVQR